MSMIAPATAVPARGERRFEHDEGTDVEGEDPPEGEHHEQYRHAGRNAEPGVVPPGACPVEILDGHGDDGAHGEADGERARPAGGHPDDATDHGGGEP
ncbi:hypothetical protein [Brevibacterium permense]|uniref:hypothetical protein n=1 Tax=Brevibacterium permense TaxID=234834 RepID=UPI0021D0DC72|nr:hypothetical protein [Brevibacterium permense]